MTEKKRCETTAEQMMGHDKKKGQGMVTKAGGVV